MRNNKLKNSILTTKKTKSCLIQSQRDVIVIDDLLNENKSTQIKLCQYIG